MPTVFFLLFPFPRYNGKIYMGPAPKMFNYMAAKILWSYYGMALSLSSIYRHNFFHAIAFVLVNKSIAQNKGCCL